MHRGQEPERSEAHEICGCRCRRGDGVCHVPCWAPSSSCASLGIHHLVISISLADAVVFAVRGIGRAVVVVGSVVATRRVVRRRVGRCCRRLMLLVALGEGVMQTEESGSGMGMGLTGQIWAKAFEGKGMRGGVRVRVRVGVRWVLVLVLMVVLLLLLLLERIECRRRAGPEVVVMGRVVGVCGVPRSQDLRGGGQGRPGGHVCCLMLAMPCS